MATQESRPRGGRHPEPVRTTETSLPAGTNGIPRDYARRIREEAEADADFGFSDPERIKALHAQLRRRGEAALRLPPLADGRRDPIGRVTDAPERVSHG